MKKLLTILLLVMTILSGCGTGQNYDSSNNIQSNRPDNYSNINNSKTNTELKQIKNTVNLWNDEILPIDQKFNDALLKDDESMRKLATLASNIESVSSDGEAKRLLEDMGVLVAVSNKGLELSCRDVVQEYDAVLDKIEYAEYKEEVQTARDSAYTLMSKSADIVDMCTKVQTPNDTAEVIIATKDLAPLKRDTAEKLLSMSKYMNSLVKIAYPNGLK